MTTRAQHLFLWGLLLLFVTACAAQPTTAPDAAVGVAADATPSPQTGGRGAGGTLRLLYWQAPTSLNPQLSAAIKDLEASRLTYEPLASYDRDGKLVPFLAAEIPSRENGGLDPEGRWVIWKLKRDVKWSDGDPFTADDVQFTYDYISNPQVGAANATDYAMVKAVEVLDLYTVKVHFVSPTPAWAQPFVGYQGMILPRHVFAPYKGANSREAPANNQPVGTGPYRVVGGIRPQEVLMLGNELIETNKIVFEANPFFREADKPFFSRIELRGGGTVGEAARSVLQDGVADFAYNLALPPTDLERLEATGKGRIIINPVARLEQLMLNFSDPNLETADGERSNYQTKHPFFSDKRVRQAISLAIDRQKIVALYGRAGRSTSNILLGPPDYVSPNTTAEYSPTKAAELLDEAGWRDSDGDGLRDKNGRRLAIVLQGPNDATTQQSLALIQTSLQGLNIEVEVNPVDPSVYYTRDPNNPNTALHFYADLQQVSFTNVSPDPTAFMQYWTCAQIPQKENSWAAGLNLGRWCSPTYENLATQVTSELDPVKRSQLFIQMNDLLINDVAAIPLAQVARLYGASSKLVGIDPTPWDASVWNIKDWRSATP